MSLTAPNKKLTLSVMFALSCYAATSASSSSLDKDMKAPFVGGGITGLLLQPSANNLQYAVYTTPLPLPAPNWYPKTVNPEYRASFDLELNYHFADRVDQIALDWLHFNSTSNANFAATIPNTSVGPTYYFGPAEQFLLNTSARSSVKFVVDDVGLVVKHLIVVSKPIQVEPFLGVDFVSLKENITNNYLGADPVYGPYAHSTYIESHYTGFGPRVGLEARYFASAHYGVNTTVAASVLVGGLRSSTNFKSWTGYSGALEHNNVPAYTTLSKLNQTVIVPKLDAKIGLFYTMPLSSGANISAEAGYMFTTYINAINQVLPSTLVPGSWEAGSVATVNHAQQQQSNLSLNGPYLSLVWK